MSNTPSGTVEPKPANGLTFETWLGQLETRIRAQRAPKPTAPAAERKPTEAEGQIYFVSENVERRIDDARGIYRAPQMVLDDNKGWTEVGWEW